MKKYTQDQKAIFYELLGTDKTVKEISATMEIPEGTLYRWKSESKTTSNKVLQTETSSIQAQYEDLRKKYLELEDKYNNLQNTVDEIVPYIRKKIKAENKANNLVLAMKILALNCSIGNKKSSKKL